MRCWIYKGKHRAETYLYVGGADATERVPEDLLRTLGPLELVMELKLSERRALARANPREVMLQIHERGYYLQLPPVDRPGSARLQ